MGKPDPDAPTGARKRQLNVIYFVDSARTRSFALSLGRLNVILFAALALLTWSVASVVLIVWLTKDREEVAGQLRRSLATVFEYETRHENVYDTAYPPAGKAAASAKVAADPSASPAAQPTTAPEPAAPAVAAAGEDKDASEEGDEAIGGSVTVSNPVLSAGSNALELEFDLTNKSDTDRAEGFIWAVAEFKTDQGEHIFIGAPAEIQVQDGGEPKTPQKSAVFNIRRFKKKGFTFPFVKDKPGVFTGVKIGVMSRSGEDKTTYQVPVEIRVGKSSATDDNETKTDEAKSG